MKGTCQQIVARRLVAALGALALLASCTTEVENLRPAQQLAAQRERPPGSVYLGWRIFQDKCARCHGAAADGTALAPNLLARMSDVGPHRFASLVLLRYDWEGLPAQVRNDSAARDALLDDIVARRSPVQPMPAWQGEPRVVAHILDLYSYLAARSDGTQGRGRPAP